MAVRVAIRSSPRRHSTVGDPADPVRQRARDNFGLICSAPGGFLAILAAAGAEHGGSTGWRKLAAICAADIADTRAAAERPVLDC